MNYLGSKKRLLPFIDAAVKSITENLSVYTFCDLFAGTGCVGRYFAPRVKKLLSNDREYYSYVLNKAYLNPPGETESLALLSELNALRGGEGIIFNEYSENGSADRLYFSCKNGKRIDAVRQKIEEWKQAESISPKMYHYLTACLLEAADRVANTASVYSAYLKNLKNTALKDIMLKPLVMPHTENVPNEVYNEDSNELVKRIKGDVLYLDPPYNGRDYGSNYHVLNTIALYDTFTPKGKTGTRNAQTSRYCLKRQALDTLGELLDKARFRYIFLSYNNEGIIGHENLRELMTDLGTYSVFKKRHTRFRSRREPTDIKGTTEFLHVLVKER